VTFRNAVCLIFTDFVLISAYPSKWRPIFEEEEPKLRACCLLRFRNGLTITEMLDASFDADEATTASIRLTTKSSRSRANDSGDTTEGKAHEVILRFADSCEAERVASHIQTLVDNSHPINSPKKAKRASVPKPKAASVGQSKDRVVPQAAHEDPGMSERLKTDMKHRRELARQRQQERGAWKPPELECPDTELARERIRRRDGVPLADREIEHDALMLRSNPIVVKSPDSGSSPVPLFIDTTPIKISKTTRARLASSRQSESLGFGSSTKLSRNEAWRRRRVNSTGIVRRKPLGATDTSRASSNMGAQSLLNHSLQSVNKTPKNGANDDEEELILFDESSLYFDEDKDKQLNSSRHSPNLDIFRAPKRPEFEEHIEVGYQSKRLIGLPWQESEYVKAANLRFEKKQP